MLPAGLLNSLLCVSGWCSKGVDIFAFRCSLTSSAERDDAVWCRVWIHIREYGEDGMGDKPAHMDTVDYWLAHFKPGSFANA
jgi:hypothetical protein